MGKKETAAAGSETARPDGNRSVKRCGLKMLRPMKLLKKEKSEI